MEIRNIKINELEAFVDSDEFRESSAIPITDLRVKGLLHNPNTKPEDVVLIVAYESGNLLGYIGALPTNINDVHCAWNSCWWVSNSAPRDLSMQLMYMFVSAWDKKVLFSEMTPHTSEIIQLMNFCKHEAIWGIRCFYRSCFNFYLPRKYQKLKPFVPLVKIADNILNVGINTVRRGIESRYVSVKTEKLEYPDKSGIDFIKKNAGVSDRKNSDIFKWIQEYHWITIENSGAVKAIDSTYYFSYYTQRFELFWVQFKEAEKIIGVAMFSIRNGELRVPYVFFERSNIEVLSQEILRILYGDKKLVSVTAFHPELVKILQNNTRGFLHKRRIPKYTAVSTDILKELNTEYFDFQMGDGDVVFT